MFASKAVRFALALGLFSGPTTAFSQTDPDDAANRVEARLDRRHERDPGDFRMLETAAEKPWSLSIGSPFRYASNPANAETGSTGAAYFDPSITLGRSWDLGGAKLSFETGADAQTFTSHSENDLSTLYGNLRVTFGAGSAIKPYVDYTVLALYDGQFESHAVTLHQFTAGAKAQLPVGKADTLVVDASVMRREASVATVEQVRLGLAFKVKHVFDPASRLVLSARGRYADYTGGSASTRTDKNLLLGAVIEHDLSDKASIDFGTTFERNWSNRTGKSYSAWEIGPSVTFTASF